MEPGDIIEAVCDESGLTTEQIKGRQRSVRIARPRHLIFMLMGEMTLLSLPEMASLLNRDHTTAMHGMRAAAKLLEENDDFRQLHTKVLARLADKNVSRETGVGEQVDGRSA